MKKKILLMVLSILLLCSMSVMLVNAQTGTVGVSAGDWFKYEINANWSSDNQSATIPDIIEQMNVMEWTNISITDISGPTVSYGGTMRFKNGTEITVPQVYDIDEGSLSIIGFFFISPNLGANDLASSNVVFGDMVINETVIRSYPDGSRETNHVSISHENTTNGKTEIVSMDFYWDRSSGVMVETVLSGATYEGGYTTTMSMEMLLDESNVWEVPEFPTWTSMLLASAVIAVIVTLYKRRLTRKTTVKH